MATMSTGQAAYKKLFLYSFALALLISLLCSGSHSAQAERAPAPVQKIEDQTVNVQAQFKSLSEKIESISKKLTKVEDDSKKKPKDFWDKLTAVSGLVTGGIVVLIGIIATYVYNKRSNKVAQVQAISNLITHLQSQHVHERQAALLAISVLGNPDLAARFADLYRDEGSIAALKSMAESGDHKAVKEGTAVLKSMADSAGHKAVQEARETLGKLPVGLKKTYKLEGYS